MSPYADDPYADDPCVAEAAGAGVNAARGGRTASSASPLIRYALWRLTQGASIPTEIMVRSHDDVLRRAVEFEGFKLTDTRELMVHQMAVRVHAESPAQVFDRVTS